MEKLDGPLFSLFQIGVCIQQLNKKSEKEVGLSLVQWCVLKNLIDMPATPAFSLAKAVGVHPSTLTQSLKRLERRKYVFVAVDPKDCRKKLISLTRLGKDVLELADASMKDWSKSLSTVSLEMNNLRSLLQGQTTRDTPVS